MAPWVAPDVDRIGFFLPGQPRQNYRWWSSAPETARDRSCQIGAVEIILMTLPNFPVTVKGCAATWTFGGKSTPHRVEAAENCSAAANGFNVGGCFTRGPPRNRVAPWERSHSQPPRFEYETTHRSRRDDPRIAFRRLFCFRPD